MILVDHCGRRSTRDSTGGIFYRERPPRGFRRFGKGNPRTRGAEPGQAVESHLEEGVLAGL